MCSHQCLPLPPQHLPRHAPDAVALLPAARLHARLPACRLSRIQPCLQERIKSVHPKTIVLSGGPNSVHVEGAPRVPEGFFEYCQENDIPVLGICYGMQARRWRACRRRLLPLSKAPCWAPGYCLRHPASRGARCCPARHCNAPLPLPAAPAAADCAPAGRRGEDGRGGRRVRSHAHERWVTSIGCR